MELVPEAGTLPTGWVRLYGTLAAAPDFAPQLKLYCDDGSGMREGRSFNVGHNDGRIDWMFYLPPGTRALRFDPAETPGDFRLENLALVEGD